MGMAICGSAFRPLNGGFRERLRQGIKKKAAPAPKRIPVD
jgi:hypothetical protein